MTRKKTSRLKLGQKESTSNRPTRDQAAYE